MVKALLIAIVSAVVLSGPAYAKEKKSDKKKVETGASCKAPAVGHCAACSITCRPGEGATCVPGQGFADACHIQPSCKCTR